jgi:hypothetical protein
VLGPAVSSVPPLRARGCAGAQRAASARTDEGRPVVRRKRKPRRPGSGFEEPRAGRIAIARA